MKIITEQNISDHDAFLQLIAAWDVNRYSWVRAVEYTDVGLKLMQESNYEPHRNTKLVKVIMDDPEEPEGSSKSITVHITTAWIADALKLSIANGGNARSEALQFIAKSPACDQATADTILQVGAYGEVVFG